MYWTPVISSASPEMFDQIIQDLFVIFVPRDGTDCIDAPAID